VFHKTILQKKISNRLKPLAYVSHFLPSKTLPHTLETLFTIFYYQKRMLTLFNDNVFLVQSMIILIQILCRQIFQIDFTD